MKTSQQERDALKKIDAQAAIDEALSLLHKASNKEAVQAAHWAGLEPEFKLFVVWRAGLAKERANDALAKFNAFERKKIWQVMEKTINACEVGKRAMQGGSVPVQDKKTGYPALEAIRRMH